MDRHSESRFIDDFPRDLSISLISALGKYESVTVTRDISIDTLNKQHTGHYRLASFSNVYGLSNEMTTKMK